MADFVLKVKTKNGPNVIKTLTSKSTVSELKNELHILTKIPSHFIHVLHGFPPKPLDISSGSKTLQDVGIVSGETLIIEEKLNSNLSNLSHPNMNEFRDRNSLLENNTVIACPGILMKHIVPADNSCLFTSIGFVLNGKVDTSVGSYMRQIIAEVVRNDMENYSEAILGKPTEDYCKWIQKPDSWGGAIELAVLSEFYGIEMAVVDTLNAIINRFGEDKRYAHRVFLMFDGIHYDPLFLEPFDGGDIQTIFLTADDSILKQAELLAMEAKSSRQFTDLNKFKLQCLVCKLYFTGQMQAHSHAKETGHMNFGEV